MPPILSAPPAPQPMHAPDGFFSVWLSIAGWIVTLVMIGLAIRSVRDHYASRGGRGLPEAEQRRLPGQFTYSKGGGDGTIAMAAAGVVCLQEFGQYDDWRIGRSMEVIQGAVQAYQREQ